MRQRLLIFFSYIGTNYKGMQTLVAREAKHTDVETIQGILELGLAKILRISQVSVVNSSRTDQGVHAIESAAHFDYTVPKPDRDFGIRQFVVPEQVCQSLNLYLEKNETDIRVRRVVQVPETYHCRRAYSRTYYYRIAVTKSHPANSPDQIRLSSALPISELYRCEVVPQPFDPQRIFEASKLFVGTWNFKTFSKVQKNERSADEGDYIKTVRRISLSRVNGLQRTYFLDKTTPNIDFYDFHVEGSGFLRRQVRKMVGALLAVASGKISRQDLLHMLLVPSEQNWNQRCQTASPHGLYLKSVNYKNLPVLRGPLS